MGDEGEENRREVLKALRRDRKALVQAAQGRLREQLGIRKEIARALAAGPLTVPEVAAAIGISTESVFWNLMAMKKYGQAAEVGQDESGDYYRYQLSGK